MGICKCFCLTPKPASKFPGKRYNILVPGIFPLTPPAIDEDLPSWLDKKLEKLHFYIQLNARNTMKVSRRLERRIRSELRPRIRKDLHSLVPVLKPSFVEGLGYVKIAVHAYVYLLARSEASDVVLYAEELVRKKDSVIEILLKNRNIHVNTLGAELLAHFLKRQTESESLSKLESMVPLLCDLCNEISTKEDLTLTAEERKLRLELRVACLRSLREHVSFMHRILAPLGDKESHLEGIMSCVLDNLGSQESIQFKRSQEQPSSDHSATSASPVGKIWNGLNSFHHMNTFLTRRGPVETSTSFDFGFVARIGKVDDNLISSNGPGTMAAQVLTELGQLAREATSAEQILTVLLNQLDQRHDWQGTLVVQRSFDVMHEAFAREHQQFLLFKILLKHAANAKNLEFGERISMIKIALEEGLGQDSQFAALVLGQCLDCLYHQLPSPVSDGDNELIPVATDFSDSSKIQETRASKLSTTLEAFTVEQDEELLRSVILSGIAHIARRVEGAMPLVDVLLGVLEKGNHAFLYDQDLPFSSPNVALFECVMAAAQALPDLPEQGGELPTRMFTNTIYQLLGLLAELPATHGVYVQGTLRMILLVGPRGVPFSEEVVNSVLSSVYNGLKNTGNSPYNYSEFSALFYTLMSKSGVSGWIKGLQFIKSLWKEALEENDFYDLDPAHVVAILFLANQCLITIEKLIGSQTLSEAMLPNIKEAIDPVLKPSRQFGGVLAYCAGGFPSEINQRCTDVLKKLKKDSNSEDLSHRILRKLKSQDFLKDSGEQDFIGESYKDIIQSPFIPEEPSVFLQRNKLNLSRSGTVGDSLHRENPEDAEEWSKRVYQMYNHNNPAKPGELTLPDQVDTIARMSPALLNSGGDNLTKSGPMLQDQPEKSRRSFLREILSAPTQNFSSIAESSVDLQDSPSVGYIP